MTDVVTLARELYQNIKWQRTPEDVTQEELTAFVARAIRTLYTMTGRASSFNEDWFVMEDGIYVTFEPDLPLDERDYVLVTAEIYFFEQVQTSVSDLVSYTTDAMSVAHADKPYANLQNKLGDLTRRQNQIWYKMVRYHHL